MNAHAHVGDGQRRARLVARHRLGGTAPDAETAVAAVVAMHASDPATPFLGVRARLADPAAAVADLERALYRDRHLWRLHAVRRTLFVATCDDAAILAVAAGRDVAAKERRRLEGWLAAELGADAVDAWLREASDEVRRVLADGVPRRTTELTAAVPRLAQQVTVGSGRWTQRVPVSSRLLFLLAMEGAIVRAAPAGTWRSSQYAWADLERWFGEPPPLPEDVAAARAALTRRYLATHGPATLADLRWWSGWTVAATRAALAAVDAVVVGLDGGGEGYLLPDDVPDDPTGEAVLPAAASAPAHDPTPSPVALLPGLDPTAMGWKERRWYLGDDDGPCARQLYDRNGNVGPTVWVDGRIVGGWAVRPDGEVAWRLLVDVGGEAADAVAAEAAALTGWLAGTPLVPRFRTPLERELSG